MRNRAFSHNLAYIFEKTGRILMKILAQMRPWTRKSLLNFGSNSDPQSGSGVRDMLSLTPLVFILCQFYVNFIAVANATILRLYNEMSTSTLSCPFTPTVCLTFKNR